MQKRDLHLNYVVPEDIDGPLETYCQETCRTATSVVRQVILEWLEGDLQIPSRVSERASGRRTSLLLKKRVMDAFEAKVWEDGHYSKGAVIAHLLRRFLARSKSHEAMIDVTLPLPAKLYNDLTAHCEETGISMERLLTGTVQDLLAKIAMQPTGG